MQWIPYSGRTQTMPGTRTEVNTVSLSLSARLYFQLINVVLHVVQTANTQCAQNCALRFKKKRSKFYALRKARKNANILRPFFKRSNDDGQFALVVTVAVEFLSIVGHSQDTFCFLHDGHALHRLQIEHHNV